LSIVWVVADGSGVAVNFDDIFMFSIGHDLEDDGSSELDTYGVRAFIRAGTAPGPDGQAGGTWVPISFGHDTAEAAATRMKEMLGAAVSAEYDPMTLLDDDARRRLSENTQGFADAVNLNREQRRAMTKHGESSEIQVVGGTGLALP
jgi:hypothetical protein